MAEEKKVSTSNDIKQVAKSNRERSTLRSQKMLDRADARDRVNGFSYILSFILLAGLFMTLFRMFINTSTPIFSLEYFLDFMKNCPSIPLGWLTNVSTMIGSLDVPDWFSKILGFLWMPISFTLWIFMRCFSNYGLHNICFRLFFRTCIMGLL